MRPALTWAAGYSSPFCQTTSYSPGGMSAGTPNRSANSSIAAGTSEIFSSPERRDSLAAGWICKFSPKRRSHPPGVAVSVSSPCIHQIFGALSNAVAEVSAFLVIRKEMIPSPMSSGRANLSVDAVCCRTSAAVHSPLFPARNSEMSTVARSPNPSPRTMTLSPPRTGSEAQMTTGLDQMGDTPTANIATAVNSFFTMNRCGRATQGAPPYCKDLRPRDPE